MIQFGIDLGGTKIEGVAVDSGAPDRALCRIRIPTEVDCGYDHVIGRIARLVIEMERATGLPRPARIGFGTPGSTDPATGLLKNSNSTCLSGRPLRDDLSRALNVEAKLANDANCLALAEAVLGSAKGRPVVVGLIIGTGVGGGIVVGGRGLDGLHGIAGEWGHNPIRGEEAPCYCGRMGCVETVISGPALERYYRERAGTDARLPQIVERARSGEPDAIATLERLVSKFGEAIAAVINIVDPDAIVIGGGVGNVEALYGAGTREAIRRHLFNPVLRTELLKPKLGDSAGVFGAAMLVR